MFYNLCFALLLTKLCTCVYTWTSLVGQMIQKSACNVEDLGSIPGPATCPEEGNGNPLQYSCLENSMMRRGAWWATVPDDAKSWT